MRGARLRSAVMLLIFLGALSASLAPADEKSPSYRLGRPATDAEIRAWNIDVAPGGEGLPPGHGTVKNGAQVYAKKCAGCHGPTGVEGPMVPLVGGRGTLATPEPVKTVGSYWPEATTLYDYIYRAMPYTAPQSLTPEEVYSLVAWILFRNGIVPEGAVMDARTLPAVQMPNRLGFVPDPRPDVPK
ncbi:MAG: c-type cytochrome [Nitrospiraceae bacterium]